MNHDETNLNPDMKTWIDPELEARVVAWVAGEASAFEIAELERMCAEKPELAIFKRRIEAVQGLVGEAARPDAAPLQLSAERRAKLLATLGATTETPAIPAPTAQPGVPKSPRADNVGRELARAHTAPASGLPTPSSQNLSPAPVAVFPEKPARRKLAQHWQWMVAAAACIGFGAVLLPGVLRTANKADGSFARMRAGEEKARAIEMPRVAAEQAVKNEALTLSPFEVSLPAPKVREAEAAPLPAAPMAAGGGGAGFVGRGGRGSGGGGRQGGQAGGAFAKNGPSAPVVSDKKTSFDLVAGAGNVTFGIAADTRETTRGTALNQSIPPADLMAPESPSRVSNYDNYALRPAAAAGSSGLVTPPVSLSEANANAPAAARSGDGLLTYGGVTGGTGNKLAQAPGSLVLGQSSVPAKESTSVLTPFEVRTDSDRGYAAGNTLSGGRLNTPLSITVPLRQQLAEADASKLKRSDAFADAKDIAAPAEVQKRAEPATDPSPPARLIVSVPVTEEIPATREPVSTFSLHVSDVSFRLAQAALARGEAPDPARIRAEEFYNAFNYGDPAPALAEKVGARIEQSAHPVLQQRNLVRIALKVPASGRGAGTPLRLTVLLDTSGSMERADRAAIVRRALAELVALLGPDDRVTLIGFARQPRLLAEDVRGDQAGALVELAARTPAEGGTNLEEALKLAGSLAQRHRLPAAQNRIVLLTDGAANLGNADPAKLSAAIEALRQQGIAFDACGVGLDGLDDDMLETLTRKGDGRYTVLNTLDSADTNFAKQLAGAFRPAAENVKVQIRFNPARVGRYRLIGFEQHRLRTEDFRNDRVDAAELAAEEAAVALYQVEVLPQGEGELGEVSVRFRDTATGTMVERSWTMTHDARASAFDRATPSMQLAGSAALLAEKLRGGAMAAQFKLGDIAPVVNALRGHYPNQARVEELVTMFAQARRLTRE